MLTTIPIALDEGLVGTGSALGRGDGKGFILMNNMRVSTGGNGLEQTAPFIEKTTLTARDYYYNGGTVSDAATTPMWLIAHTTVSSSSGSLFSVGNVIRDADTQLQVIRQTQVTGGTATLYNSVLLVVNNYASLGITLGSTLEVEMTAAALFRWRKNGGGWTAGLVPSTAGVSIDSGNATLYFLANSGFAGTETTTWTRTDYAFEDLVTTGNIETLPTALVGEVLYFLGPDGRLLVYQNGGVRTAGYRPVFGWCLAVYQNHLLVGGYVATAGQGTYPNNVIISSDLGNLENFFSTDTNEADTYTLIGDSVLSNSETGNGVWRLSVIQGTLYAYTSGTIWSTTYFGLPIVFSFQQTVTGHFTRCFGNLSTPRGDYIVTFSGPAFFDGNSVTSICEKIPSWFRRQVGTGTTPTAARLLWGVYDNTRLEMLYYLNDGDGVNNNTAGKGFLVYQEVTGTWYYRAADFSTTGAVMHAACVPFGNPSIATYGNSLLIAHGRLILQENTTFASTAPVYDVAGTSYMTPTATTLPLFFASPDELVDLVSCYVEGYYRVVGFTYAPTGISVTAARYQFIAAGTSDPQTAVWTYSNAAAYYGITLSMRLKSRAFSFTLKPRVASATVCSIGFVVSAFGATINTAKRTEL